MVRTSYEGGAIDEVFKPGTEPGSDGAVTSIDGTSGMVSGGGQMGTDPSFGGGGRGAPGGGGRRPALSGTGETY